jgi:membrane dipeptidase
MALDFPVQNPQGIQNSADFPNLTDALLTRAYIESEARKILGENMIRLFNDVWNA